MHPVYYKDGKLMLIDQRLLPQKEIHLAYTDYRKIAEAIVDMVVRGAPAIGVTAAYGLYFAAEEFKTLNPDQFVQAMKEAATLLAATRPTAVNLFWAIERMENCLKDHLNLTNEEIVQILKREADAVLQEDIAMCRAIGQHGNALIPNNAQILTHCNAGALATAGYGTALGVVRAAQEAGKNVHVYADETRPFLQGSRLTAYELHVDDIPVTLITDNMAGWMMKQGKIDCVVVGADRIAANGDVANKIGTFSLAVLAHYHNIPFYVAAPTSTIDFKLVTGKGIVIEERNHREVTHIGDIQLAPEGIGVRNPAFDVTDHPLITAIITEKGVLKPPYKEGIARLSDNL